MLACALLVPPLVLAEDSPSHSLAAGAAVVLGVALVWLYVTLQAHPEEQPYPSLGDWLSCTAVAAAFSLALAGASLLLRRVGLVAPFAALLVVLAGLAWLAWPVWLSPWMGNRDALVTTLTAVHPPWSSTASSATSAFGTSSHWRTT